MKQLVGLVALVAGIIMVITLFPSLVDGFKLALNSTTEIWGQIKAVVAALWGFVYQPLVLITIGLIALDDKK